MTHARPPARLRNHLVESVSFRGRRVVCECGDVLTIDPEIGPPRPFRHDAARNEAVAELFRLHRREVGLSPGHVSDTFASGAPLRWNGTRW
jgi:hypothetical protein